MFGATQLSDEVVRAAAAGSQDGLGRVLEIMQAQVRLMVVARLCPTPAQLEAVEEITQQAMVALMTGITRLQSRTVGGLKAFVSVIVAHKVSDLLKNRGPGNIRPAVASLDSAWTTLSEARPLWEVLSSSGTSPLSAVERAERGARLMSELGQLKSGYREVITLAFFDQLPVGEIARRMGTSRPAASMLLIRAVKTLRRNMTGSYTVKEPYDVPI